MKSITILWNIMYMIGVPKIWHDIGGDNMDRYTSENSYINKEKGSNKFFIDEASVIFPRIYQEPFFFSTDM